MKIATYQRAGQERIGAVVDSRIYDLVDCITARETGDPATAVNVLTLLAAGRPAMDHARDAVAWAVANEQDELSQPLTSVQMQAPIPCPGKLLCLAGNYASHILEGGGTYPGKEKMIPRFFMKPCSAVIGTGSPIRVPPSTGFADWELELAVVIGQMGRDITVLDAPSHIAGYTIFNDISARELTFRKDLPQQEGDYYFDWLVGKWLDSFGPMGPWLTTADEILHPDRLTMQLWHNDTLQQDASTGQMIFSPAEAIAFISQFITLYPGDLISTGTPAGVGHSKKIRLMPGDRIRGEIQGLGVLENPVEAL